MLDNKRILLIVGGGIAAYKSLELIRLFKKSGAQVTSVLTKAAQEFITPLSVGALSGEQVYTDLFSLTDELEMGHIELSRAADLLVVAPATADLIAKMAAGAANDLASTVLLATDKLVAVAPSMNVRMWHHPATQRNVALLKADGVHCIGPDEGEMACGEFGLGRMADPEAILNGAARLLSGEGPLKGKHVLVTSGPTHEPIDPVRVIANRSSGRQGHAIAAAAAAAGARVTLVSGPVHIPDPLGVDTIHVETAAEMLAAVEHSLPADVAICAAAVADWRVAAGASAHKIKKNQSDSLSITLSPNPDILAFIARHGALRPRLVVGFTAETEDLIVRAQDKRKIKGCDWIVANDVSPGSGVFGGENNRVSLVTSDRIESWPSMPKDQVARQLVEMIMDFFNHKVQTQ